MRLRYAAAGLVAGLLIATVASGKSHAVARHPSKNPKALERQLVKAVRHTSYVCANGKRGAWWTRGHCRRERWARESLERLREARRAREAPSYVPGGVWYELAVCESGRRPPAWFIATGNGFYGAYQFLPSTWRSVGGSGYPHQASPAEQTRRAQILQARDGWGQWPDCSARLGLR